jgi:hypothetical protein
VLDRFKVFRLKFEFEVLVLAAKEALLNPCLLQTSSEAILGSTMMIVAQAVLDNLRHKLCCHYSQ